MRITNNVLVNNLKNNLSRNIRTLERIQTQLSSGRKISKPSQDPTGIVESLRLETRLRENAIFQQNVEDAKSWLTTTDEALSSLTTALQRVYELTVEAANGTFDTDEREAICAEVKEIINEVGEIANTTHGDRYIFGGTNTTQRPYDKGTWYHNKSRISYEIGVGVEITINFSAQEVFLDSGVMDSLQNVVTYLENNDLEALSEKAIAPLQEALDQVLAIRAKVGASVNRLEMTKARLEEQEINFSNLQAEVDGVDPALVIMELKEQENVYRASLAVGARVIMPSLVDFLS